MSNTEHLARVAKHLKEALRLLEADTIPAVRTWGSPDARSFIEAAGITNDPSRSTKFSDFYTLYTIWCTNTGFEASSKQRIGAQLAALGYAKGHRAWGKQIMGMKLPDALLSSLPALDLSRKSTT